MEKVSEFLSRIEREGHPMPDEFELFNFLCTLIPAKTPKERRRYMVGALFVALDDEGLISTAH